MVAVENNSMYNSTRQSLIKKTLFAKLQTELSQQTLDMTPEQDNIEATYYKANALCQSRQPSNLRFKHRQSSLRQQRKYSDAAEKDADLNCLLDKTYNSHTKCILMKVSDWSFDVFALDKASKGRALFHIILKLFQHHNLINHFDLDLVKLMQFASLVEEGYHNNPYHNAVHAADVTQAMHCYISQTKIAKHMTPTEILIALLSAITHDLDHPGVNQSYLIATHSHLAALYENKAVLEKHHWRTAIGALHQTGLLNHLSYEIKSQIEEEMKSLILATDMTRQQEFFTLLRKKVEEGSLDLSNYNDRHFILQIALKCADISNPCRHWSACKKWSTKVCDEFFRQGDYERDLGLPISNLCDRYSNPISKIQTGFISYVVEPLFTEFEKFLFPCSMLSEQLINLKDNLKKWQDSIEIKVAVRPTTLTLNLQSVVPSISDIPSPNSQSDDEPEEDDDCECPIEKNLSNRRQSLPILNLMQSSKLLSRRQSFPSSSLSNTNTNSEGQKKGQVCDSLSSRHQSCLITRENIIPEINNNLLLDLCENYLLSVSNN